MWKTADVSSRRVAYDEHALAAAGVRVIRRPAPLNVLARIRAAVAAWLRDATEVLP